MKKIHYLLLLYVSICQFSFGQTKIDANSKSDLAQIQKLYQASNRQISDELREMYPINLINAVEYVSFLGKVNNGFNPNQLLSLNAIVGKKISSIISFKLPIDQLNQVDQLNGFEIIQLSGKIKPELNKVHWDVNIDSVWQGIGLSQGYTGKNVIIGITDWGFDYSSPMFYDTLLQNTRILSAWDQFKNSGPAPANFAYGTEYSTPSEFVTAGADTANIYSYATHGTHVAGIAGGSGAGTPYRGMAFEANYVFTTFLVDEGAVLDAWQWMYEKAEAENKRLVINMSWGLYYMGANDGTSLLSQALDAFSDLDVVFVTSAGNNGDVNFHMKKDFNNDTIEAKVEFYSSTMPTLFGQSIHAWGEAGNDFSMGVVIYDWSNNLVGESEYFNTSSLSNYIDSFVVVGADSIWFNVSADAAYPTNGRSQMRLRIKKSSASLKIGVRASSSSGIVHFWNVTELTNDVGNWGMPFTTLYAGSMYGDALYGIGAPACTQSAISVGAHVAKYFTGSSWIGGQPTTFSSQGPLMTEVMKPDISAPGAAVASSISSYTDNAYNPIATVSFNGRDYPFAKFSGTSMSSPCVTGIVAVMLEANPYLSPEQVKQIIQETAYEDQYTGIIPAEGSAKWGQGKIDAYAAVLLALNTISIAETNFDLPWNIFPNPSMDKIELNLNLDEVSEIRVIDMMGKVVIASGLSNVVAIDQLNPGTYILRIVRNSRVEQQTFIKQ